MRSPLKSRAILAVALTRPADAHGGFSVVPPAWPLAIVGVLGLQTILTLGHDAWLDEWQAIQLAYQSPDVATLLQQLRYEGHPPLWYLLLRTVATITGPQDALRVTALACALATQAMILLRAPFPRVVRVLLCLSEIILFEYNTIARGFTLGLTMTIATLALWHRGRWAWWPIALLPAVDFLFGVFSLIFVAFRLIEGERNWTGVTFWLALSVLSAIAIIPIPGMAVSLPPGPDLTMNAATFLQKLSMVVFPLQWGSDGLAWNEGAPWGLHAYLWIGFFILCREQTRGRRSDQLALFGFLSVQLAMSVWVYALPIRHVMQVAILIIALQWRRSGSTPSGEDAKLSPVFVAWISSMATCGIITAGVALVRPFDAAPQVVEAIHRHGLVGENWAAEPAFAAASISALSGIKFDTLNHQCRQDFIRRDFASGINDASGLIVALSSKLEREGRFYLLSTRELHLGELALQVEAIPAGFNGYGYRIYEVGAGMGVRPYNLPRCVPGMRDFPPANLN